MSDLNKQLAELRSDVRVKWTEERARRVERSLLRRRRRQRVLHATAGVMVLAALMVLGRAALRARSSESSNGIGSGIGSGEGRHVVAVRPPPASTPFAPMPVEKTVAAPLTRRLADGSVVYLLDPMSRLVELSPVAVEGVQPELSLELESGAARFEVVHNPARVFRVRSGRVLTEVLGTVFSIERRAEHSYISVERGRVRVSWPTGQTELGEGQSGTFPPEPDPEAARPLPARAAVLPTLRGAQPGEPRRPFVRTEPLLGMPRAVAPQAGSNWAALAQEGNFDSAYIALRHYGMDAVGTPAGLLLAADVARLSGHPAEAVAPLRQLLNKHPQDPRAPLAAFTLGRGLLDELGRPREAAEAFRTAQDLAPDGPLAGDALAREVEAWSRAGEAVRANERALLYLKQYPEGDRRRSVQRYGGVE